ncbi:UvrD/REP helicase [Legionella beliardensis]|uniref:DNA 3'-5' helicase n=1 Tax=Legionella beliardensis TaxID=91822 RepID=A0A378I428_9GAMM|nr:UvrD-helicase domain-containing protein [Legionella beliardensis]STX29510.1 UvrD/REP helicase [Legionella beliardensis]
MLKDHKQREQATDPSRSFIVQAPAGSGKTELLTQRFLRLLSTVTSPEQIVALTFTRKAASEMRERIITALQRAADGLEATTPHQQLTKRYAQDALKQSQKLNWQLLKQPGSLKIMTIDALCQTISQAIFLDDEQIPYAKVSDDPQGLYQHAIREWLNDVLDKEALHYPLQVLLHHLDNRQDKLILLLSDLLKTREQWLPALYAAHEQTKETFEQALYLIEQHELERFLKSFPLTECDELRQLCSQFASLNIEANITRQPLRTWNSVKQFNKEIATCLAMLLLTKDDKLRKSFDHHVGLKRDCCAKEVYDDLKVRSKDILYKLGQMPDFLKALIRLKNLPPPHYNAEQWEVLQALLTLLPLLAAHLHITFSIKNQVDFTAISQQALLALGDDLYPTDLALYLDHAICHLLIDEFQDTSIQQFQLLKKLTQGWSPNDGKTLFIVGDPMQSIYRFRQAEVGLFIKARQHGLGHLNLIPLELCSNFRSTKMIVDWVNEHFKTIFPKQDDIETGAISFHASTHVLTETTASWIKAQQVNDKLEEASAVVNLIKQELEKYPQDKIAILVRSRTHLTDIVSILRRAKIPFQGIDIEKLSSLAHLVDIWSLTKALLMPANRLAWLALLRSPWCGLSLKDLYYIANFNKYKSIYYALANLDKLPQLSEEGLIRAHYLYTVMQRALNQRQQKPLVDSLLDIMKQLHGDLLLNDAQQLDIEQFWSLLNRFTKDGQISDIKQLELEFKRLYSQQVSASRLHIMTIHKSKGLEFDAVILPSLGSKAQQQDKPLLRWLKLPRQTQDDLLLMSPVRAAQQKHCPLYDYLAEIDLEKESYEQQRLLYVAVTRAKKRLYLFDNQQKITTNTMRDLLKAQSFTTLDLPTQTLNSQPLLPSLKRLPVDFYIRPPADLTPGTTSRLTIQINDKTNPADPIIHELLYWIFNNHPSQADELPWGTINRQLQALGFTKAEQQHMLHQLQTQIATMLASDLGKWLCKAHVDERSPYELLTYEDSLIKTKLIDRTFYDKDVYWLINIKTRQANAEEQRLAQEELNKSAMLLQEIIEVPIKLGLFYLPTGLWLNWTLTPALCLSNEDS